MEMKEFWTKKESLYVVDDVLLYGNSVVVPNQLKPAILETLGSANQGVAAMKARAKYSSCYIYYLFIIIYVAEPDLPNIFQISHW